MGESISQATERLMKEKFAISIKFEKVDSISVEHIKKSGKVIHSFLLILVSAKTKERIKLINIDKNRRSIIKSDYQLMKSKFNTINIETIYSKIWFNSLEKKLNSCFSLILYKNDGEKYKKKAYIICSLQRSLIKNDRRNY